MLEIRKKVEIKDYNTFQIGGQFRYFIVISKVSDLISTWSIIQKDIKYKNIPIFILGGGSNIVFPDKILNVIALKIEIKDFKILNETDEYIDIKVGAGEILDDFIARTVRMGFSGLESLSLIPGTIGATPVQNVGAYGTEVKDTIISVEAFDTKNNKIIELSNNDCQFKYRDSIFKNVEKGRYIITAVTYRLNKALIKIPDYHEVKKYLIEYNINDPKLKDIREAVIYIRNNKLPNPKKIPNVGSFFKNPIVEKNIAKKIKEEYDDLTIFSIDEKTVKIPAGWLIEKVGLKGKSFGKVSVYHKNALVLVNNGNATKKDLILAKNEIIRIVKKKFGIILEQEPEMF